METLSPRIRRRIERDFPEPVSTAEAVALVESASTQERVRAAVVISAAGDLTRLRAAVRLAETDWRDAIVGAGLGDENWPTVLDAQFGPSA